MIKKNKTVKYVILGIFIPILAIVAIYVSVSVFYSGHFFPGTWLNGIDCSNMPVSEVKDILSARQQEGYTLRIIQRNDRVEDLKDTAIGYVAAFDSVDQVKEQQGMWLWPLSFAGVNYYTAENTASFDEAKLRAAIASLEGVSGSDVVAPVDAYIDYSDGIKVIPEVMGTTINQDKLYEVLAETITNGRSVVNIDEADCYEVPAVTMESEDFRKTTESIRKITDTVIKLHIGGDTYETIDGDVTSKWLYQAENGDVEIDEEKVQEYMYAMEEKHSTWGDDRQFKTSYDTEVTVYGGNYGWSIDAEAEARQVLAELKAGENVEREVTFDGTAAVWGGNEIGDTYVEISIDNQHMWFYKGGELITDTDIVSGCVSEGHGTPKGAYKILNKAMYQTLVGTDPNDPYESKVTFWLPFIGNAYGIHDSSWRYYYGGTIYYYNGSHGCVNTPYSKVQIIYNNIEIGTPVIIW